MNKTSRMPRTAVIAGVAGLTFSLSGPALLATPLATAQEQTPPPAPLIDVNAIGSLTIHKRANPEGDLPAPTGEEVNNAPGTPLDGVGFTIYKLNDVTLTTNQGIAEAAGKKVSDYLNPDGTVNTSKVTAVGTQQTTDAQGETTFSNLALGAYLVVETAPKEGYTPAAPFLAFVPMTKNNAGTGGTSWLYNVHAYPKNYEQNKPVKTVEDTNIQAGQKLTYTVSAFPQPLGQNQARTKFWIEDTLDAKLTPPSADDITVAVAAKPGVTPAPTIPTFAKGTDYTVTVTDQKVSLQFTADGVKKLTAQMQVSLTIPATVKNDTAGQVPNTATVIENNPNGGEDNRNDTPPVKTYYGKIQFTKVDADNPQQALKGAEFQIYGRLKGETCNDTVVENQDRLITVNGQNTFTSGDNGLVAVSGLHVNNIDDNQPNATADQYEAYCLVETKSPANYELLAQPIEFILTSSQAESGDPLLLGNSDGQVKNLKDTTPNLPATGGMGVGIIAGLGALIAGAGAWFFRRNSKTQG